MILYIKKKSPKDSIKKLLELINQSSKGTKYKLNIQKSAAFLYTDNELYEKEINKNPFHNG
jgi:hypothetical protein